MRWLLDLLYLGAAVVTAPVWLYRMIQTGKIRTDWAGRFGSVRPSVPVKAAPRVLVHAVSVGEVNAARELVARLASGDSLNLPLEVIVATTTDTGFARASVIWPVGGKVRVVRYPLDFSPAVARFLRAIDPDAVVLMELEVWPNFARLCAARGIPMGVVNGRLTQRSFQRYRKVQWIMRPAFAGLTFAGVQNATIGQRFREMGVSEDRVIATGTMKWDTAFIADTVDGAEQLSRDLGIDPTRALIVAGSTAPGEHELLHAATPPDAQLLCAPRKPEWFEQAAAALPGCVRRSQRSRQLDTKSETLASGRRPQAANRFLLDTIGELRQAYALADVVVIGRSFGSLHGSDMMEPVALGKAVIVGPAVSDFQDTVDALLAGGGIVQTTVAQLPRVIADLLADAARRHELAERGRAVIRQHQGATSRNLELIRHMLAQKQTRRPGG
jgi:3-deoxy-D-manno-octulosonic-acid transferase